MQCPCWSFPFWALKKPFYTCCQLTTIPTERAFTLPYIQWKDHQSAFNAQLLAYYYWCRVRSHKNDNMFNIVAMVSPFSRLITLVAAIKNEFITLHLCWINYTCWSHQRWLYHPRYEICKSTRQFFVFNTVMKIMDRRSSMIKVLESCQCNAAREYGEIRWS
jgi:hypothetical protein